MSTLKVDGIRSNSATSDAITLAGDGTCTANITNRTNKNLIINGAMQVAQRGTSSTSDGYHTIDRFQMNFSGTDEAPTQAQVDVSSGTTPYTNGFRKAFKITNGNQTSGAGTSDRIEISYKLEAQDLANSGWNYTSSSSFITLSFWCKSSVAQNFFCRILTSDGTSQRYAVETGSLTADTWTKITKTIPGNSNLQFDNNNAEGLKISVYQFAGTDYTDSSSLNTWAAGVTGNRTPDQTSTWYTTNDATFEITGVQLEVGSTATDFEHRSFGQELALCQRYFHKSGDIGTNNEWFAGVATHANHGAMVAKSLDGDSDRAFNESIFPVLMRGNPTLVFYPARTGLAQTAGNFSKYNGDVLCAITSQPSSSPFRMTGYFQSDTDHVAFTFQYTADSEL